MKTEHMPEAAEASVGDETASWKEIVRKYQISSKWKSTWQLVNTLVPYAALRQLVFAGRTAEQIARRFHVSRPLVEYRIKVTHLWAIHKSVSASRNQHV